MILMPRKSFIFQLCITSTYHRHLLIELEIRRRYRTGSKCTLRSRQLASHPLCSRLMRRIRLLRHNFSLIQ
uniref:Uncharacterized protein n=1 Tax=Parascaris equorum TaxID=6256 RepID=A0A914SIJ6_PAREQ